MKIASQTSMATGVLETPIRDVFLLIKLAIGGVNARMREMQAMSFSGDPGAPRQAFIPKYQPAQCSVSLARRAFTLDFVWAGEASVIELKQIENGAVLRVTGDARSNQFVHAMLKGLSLVGSVRMTNEPDSAAGGAPAPSQISFSQALEAQMVAATDAGRLLSAYDRGEVANPNFFRSNEDEQSIRAILGSPSRSQSVPQTVHIPDRDSSIRPKATVLRLIPGGKRDHAGDSTPTPFEYLCRQAKKLRWTRRD